MRASFFSSDVSNAARFPFTCSHLSLTSCSTAFLKCSPLSTLTMMFSHKSCTMWKLRKEHTRDFLQQSMDSLQLGLSCLCCLPHPTPVYEFVTNYTKRGELTKPCWPLISLSSEPVIWIPLLFFPSCPSYPSYSCCPFSCSFHVSSSWSCSSHSFLSCLCSLNSTSMHLSPPALYVSRVRQVLSSSLSSSWPPNRTKLT